MKMCGIIWCRLRFWCCSGLRCGRWSIIFLQIWMCRDTFDMPIMCRWFLYRCFRFLFPLCLENPNIIPCRSGQRFSISLRQCCCCWCWQMTCISWCLCSRRTQKYLPVRTTAMMWDITSYFCGRRAFPFYPSGWWRINAVCRIKEKSDWHRWYRLYWFLYTEFYTEMT